MSQGQLWAQTCLNVSRMQDGRFYYLLLCIICINIFHDEMFRVAITVIVKDDATNYDMEQSSS
jgi:hypothetical protein